MTDDIRFFLERLQAEIPTRIHTRDIDSGGAPDWAHAFEAYITDGEHRWSAIHRDDQEVCNHPTLPGKGHCVTCDDTGLRVRTRKVFRHPMKRALEELGRRGVPKGRPPLDQVLLALAEHDGNVEMAIAALRNRWAFMWQPMKARRWISHALWEVRAAYREDVPVWRGVSESQSIAEKGIAA